MRSKRIRRQINDDPNRWLLSYADFMTLLFAFFVVLYAMSSINVNKYKTVAQSVGYAFDRSKSLKDINNILLVDKQKVNLSPAVFKAMTLQQKKFVALNSNLKKLDGKFYNISKHSSWYEIEIKSSSLFESGKATLSKNAISELELLANKLKKVNGSITVEGYTDSIPIRSLRFPSNWALSSARAAIIAQTLYNSGLENKNISAVGYSSQFPIATNQTPIGRAKNRRVVIVVAKNNHSERLLNPIKSKSILRQDPFKTKNTKTVNTMKEIPTKNGGIKFIQSIEEKPIKKTTEAN